MWSKGAERGRVVNKGSKLSLKFRFRRWMSMRCFLVSKLSHRLLSRRPWQLKKGIVVLGIIGNIVTVCWVEGKRLPQVFRPVTGRFCAQLLANAQSTAAQKTKSNGGAIVVDGALPDKKGPHRKPLQKKSAPKPRPLPIIEISPETNEVLEKEKPMIDKENPKRRIVEKERPSSKFNSNC